MTQGTWGHRLRGRLPLLGLAALTGLIVGQQRAGQGGTWETLLASHEVRAVQTLHWIDEAPEGQWSRGLAQVKTAPIDDKDPGDNHDIILFEGMRDGSGQPYKVRRVGNLMRTPDADDHILDWRITSEGAVALVATRVAGLTTSVSMLDLAKDARLEVEEDGSRRSAGDRFKLAVINLQDRGQSQGVGQQLYVLQEPAQKLTGRLEGEQIVLHATVDGEQRWATLDQETGEVMGVHDPALALHPQSEAITVESWVQFAVNRSRRVSWIGPNKIALLEKYVFDRVDRARQTWYAVVGVDRDKLTAELTPEDEQPQDGAQAGTKVEALPEQSEAIVVGEADIWPLPDLEAPAKDWHGGVLKGEGKWRPWIPSWENAKGRRASWPVLRTSVRVTRAKEYEFITLVAMDMRQLDLHLLGGSVNPRSTTGLRGTGLIPRDPEVLRRTMLAFNGGFKTSHGAFGMVLDRKVFVPPKPAMATLGILETGEVRMGSWPGDAPTGHYRTEQLWQVEVAKDAAPVPDDVVDMRQNLPPLIAGSQLNPSGARRWGGPVAHLSHTSTPRSAVCIREPHVVVYAWGHRTSAKELGTAMILAGCQYGMHLDMNPFHSGLSMLHFPVGEDGSLPPKDKDLGFVGAKAEVPTQKMQFDRYRYLRRDVKDFFYVTRRPALPARLRGEASGLRWSPRGLPIEQAGLHALALSAQPKEGVILLALESKRFAAKPSTQEAEAAQRGELRLSLRGPKETDGTLALIQDGGHLRLSSTVGPDVEIITKGKALVRDGKALPVERAVQASSMILVAMTTSEDLVMAACDNCTPDDLLAVLAPSQLVHALWWEGAAFQVASAAKAKMWGEVLPWTGSKPVEGQELHTWSLSPVPGKSRVAVSSFEASKAATSKP